MLAFGRPLIVLCVAVFACVVFLVGRFVWRRGLRTVGICPILLLLLVSKRSSRDRCVGG